MSDGLIFLIFSVTLFVPSIALAIRMTVAQRAYLRAYQAAHPQVPLLDDENDPTQVLSQLRRAGNTVNAYHERQDDPELERLRQIVVRRTKETFSWGFGFPIVFFILATVFHR